MGHTCTKDFNGEKELTLHVIAENGRRLFYGIRAKKAQNDLTS